MKETGRVINIEDGKVEVAVGVSTMCRHCEAGCMEKGRERIVSCRTSLPVKVGDRVVVHVPDRYLLGTAFFAYGLPTIGFFAFLLLFSYVLNAGDVVAVLAGLAATVAAVFVTRFFFRGRREDALTPTIVEVL